MTDIYEELRQMDKRFREEQIRGEKMIAFFFVLIVSMATFLYFSIEGKVEKPKPPCHCVH